ncbi:MAG: c-type cytochrome biogenesis protein CcsB [Bacteroidales bacterium]|nr:MAG: c-type cytochrome biogenesis protein CcsB [Bacteroidales bacterium]
MKKFSLFLFSSGLMGVLFIAFAISMAVATFIENDYGSLVAFKWVYSARWFEIILLLLAVNLIGQTIKGKLYSTKKLTILMFHLSFILMIIGAGITRYFGFDGSIHIREGESQNVCTSAEKYIHFTINNKSGKQLFHYSKPFTITPKTIDRYSKKVMVDNTPYSLKLLGIIPNAIETIDDTPNGQPMVSLMITSGMMGRQSLILKQGATKTINGLMVGFNTEDSLSTRISFEQDSFYIQSKSNIIMMNMMSQSSIVIEKERKITLKPMLVYNINGNGFVVQKLSKSGVIKPISHGKKQNKASQNVLEFELKSGDNATNLYVWADRDLNGSKDTYSDDKNRVEVSYGPKEIALPFEIRLNKFVLERYPGSNSPSSYKSEVTLTDKEQNIDIPYSIYMNHILKHRGYRFYQSSFDNDEKGTILSVNHDKVGMMVTYAGYIFLFLFIILSIFNKNSLLKTITINAWNSPIKKVGITLLAIFFSTSHLIANDEKLEIDKTIADHLGKVLVQDQKGRTKPLNTLSNDIFRKVTKKNQFQGYSSMQLFLGFYADFDNWKNVPLIKVSNSELANRIGIKGDYAAFSDIVDLNSNTYKLASFIEESYAKPEDSRSKFDKEVLKLDERVNVCYMIYTGEFLKIFPLKDKSTKWGSPNEALKFAENKDDSLYLKNIMGIIIESSQSAAISKDNKEIDDFINSITNYQKKFAGYSLPSERKVNVEVLYNKANIFERLFPFYATLGLILIITLVFGIISGKQNLTKMIKGLSILLLIGFAAHTLGLALRWYISGHAPMSNGYESMLFISWATLLAGFIFSKKSPFALSATAVLAALTLLVAHLSFMDPEITNLVPVLKSYWLTLHVSIITGSYGFLGLGAILGFLVMILYSFTNPLNKERISKTIDELTIINYKTITLGLYFLTIGTFLGAIWANESWGRYWGWDPKETWSLITIIIYSFVIHSRMIKSLRSIYTFNLLSLFAFSSVLMTYFGVNYYLSGLHSYASGDPIPVPTFVYVTIVSLFVVSTIALFKYKQLERNEKMQ